MISIFKESKILRVLIVIFIIIPTIIVSIICFYIYFGQRTYWNCLIYASSWNQAQIVKAILNFASGFTKASQPFNQEIDQGLKDVENDLTKEQMLRLSPKQ